MKRILVAEDRPGSLELVRALLILLDLQMPKIDGFGVPAHCEEISGL
jgi:DNA-binding response OmpR family regulator